MKDQTVDKERLTKTFLELIAIDSESFHEKEAGGKVVEKLRTLGLKVDTLGTEEAYLKAHPESFPNIHALLEGNRPGEPILFSAHLDTVSPGKGKKACITKDGRITSLGDTVLGADDAAGLSAILEALACIQEKKIPHPSLELLITPAEEPFCEGSRAYDFNRIKARNGYVLDLTGKPGEAAYEAPSIISFEIDVTGRASHAGFAPEEGINALTIAASALQDMKAGRLDRETTLNFGLIRGGSGKNIVPENIHLEGEIRSFRHEKALKTAEVVFHTFREKALKAGGVARCQSREHIRAYRLHEEEWVVRHFKKAVSDMKLEANLIPTFGGSDANRLNEHGIRTLVLASAMERVHSKEEYTVISELITTAELTLKLMTREGENI